MKDRLGREMPVLFQWWGMALHRRDYPSIHC